MTQSNSHHDARSRAAQSHAQPQRGEHGEHGGRSARTLDGAATPKLPAPEGEREGETLAPRRPPGGCTQAFFRIIQAPIPPPTNRGERAYRNNPRLARNHHP
jgi:hypothetical protein